MSRKVLIAGESWQSTTVHTKGFDSFVTSTYAEGVAWLRTALEKAGYTVDFLPNHRAFREFPMTMEEIKQYDVVMLSDIGSNTLLLHPDTFERSASLPNRCTLIRDYVLDGGGLCMIGGYLTFTGIDAKGRWGCTDVQDVLPVTLLEVDDRREHPEGIVPAVTDAAHPIFAGIEGPWPAVLGYNKTLPGKDAGAVLATIGGNPFIAVGSFGKGRAAAFTTDCSPHWAPPDFCNWKHYDTLWANMANWLARA